MHKENSGDSLEFEKVIKLFSDSRNITIPKNVEKLLRSKLLKKELLKIHRDSDLAIEYCLVFLSNFSTIDYENNNQGNWKALSSVILQEQIPGSDGRYKRVIDLLLSNIFSSRPIIETKLNERGTASYEVGKKSKQYRLSDQFLNQGSVKYKISSDFLINHRQKQRDININKGLTNPIAKNLLTIYPKITFPTQKEILVEAKKLVKNKYYNNKGKRFTILNGRKKSLFKDFDRRVAYEDNIKRYRDLIDSGLLVPTISGERAGGRVYDSFNLMPTFIRHLIKIDNEHVVNVDFKCLHPNLSIKLYNGNSKFLTHQLLADELKLDVKDIKVEHISFFNKEPYLMKESKLFEYYEKNEPIILENLIRDKNENKDSNITSQRLF
ncbi:hypothetical protein DNC80_15805, partial [Flavobacterium sp. SOK18b]|uniref:hypothetical protein n=1 Tax=Flavobacterium sp. SOK18b TaxID=797900 RepID=UPI0015FB45FF